MFAVSKGWNKGERLEGFALSNSLLLSPVEVTDHSFMDRLACLTNPFEPVVRVVVLTSGDFEPDRTWCDAKKGEANLADYQVLCLAGES